MPYLGTISSAGPYTLEVTCITQTAVTVLTIQRDKIAVVEVLVVQPGAPPLSRTASSGTQRVVMLASTMIGNTATVKVTQGANLYQAGISPDGNVQFDVV